MTGHQKLGMILENKACKKLKLSEANFNKQCAPDLFFLNWKQKSDEFGWLKKQWMAVHQKVPKSFFQSEYFFNQQSSKFIWLRKKNRSGTHCLLKLALDNSAWDNFNFYTLYSIKSCPMQCLTDCHSLHVFTKYNDFFWACWFLDKNLAF